MKKKPSTRSQFQPFEDRIHNLVDRADLLEYRRGRPMCQERHRIASMDPRRRILDVAVVTSHDQSIALPLHTKDARQHPIDKLERLARAHGQALVARKV